MTDRSESETVAQLDPENFSQHYRDGYRTLRLVAASEVGLDHAEDVVQQAAIVAMERLDRFEPGTNFLAWMSAIVRGVARNYRRGERRRRDRDQRHEPEVSAVEAAIPTVRPGGAGGVPTIEFPPDFDEQLRNAVESLGPLQQCCLLLKSVQGHSYREIGAILDMPEATARSHVHRARQVLADRLQPDPSSGGGDLGVGGPSDD